MNHKDYSFQEGQEIKILLIVVRGLSGVQFGLYNHTSDYKIAGVQFVNHDYDYRPTSDNTKSTYQLIIKLQFSRSTRNENTFGK